jgi:type IV secretion system protein VirB4
MQFLSRLNPARPDFAHEQSAGSRLPYAHHVNDRVVRLRDGTLMLAIRMQGLLFETAETDEINYRKSLRDAMLRAIGSSRYAIYHHIVRRRVQVEPSGTFPDAFSRDLDAMWQQRLASKSLYTNELFLTLIRRPMQGSAGVGSRIARWLGKGRNSAEAEAWMLGEARALEAAGEQLLAALATYRPAMLSVYDTPHGPCSEPLEMLALLYNADLAPVRLPYGDAGEVLPRRRVSFGADTLELAPTAQAVRSLAAVVSAKDYPGQTAPGMLDELLRIPAEMVITQSFAFVDRQASLGRMNLALRRMRASDDEALSLRSELAQAKDEVAAGRAAYGEHHLTVMVRGESQAAVDGGVAEVQSALTDLGMVTVREDIGLEAAFWAQFPGNFGFIVRRVLIGSANFASLASWHNFPAGKPFGNHWGEAVATFETTAAGPYHFNFHQGDLGNFTAIGPSGSGKTVIVNFLLAQARRFAPRIVFFDKDRGAELFIRAIGGVYDILRPGVPSRMNPLLLVDSPENRRFLIEWIAQLVGSDGTTVTIEDLAQIKEAVDASMASPPAYRRLASFVELLRGNDRPHPKDLYARMRPWWGKGEHAWLFDNAEDQVDLSRDTIGFDMTRLLDDPVLRTPAMMYMFHRVDQGLDGSPAIIVVDEGWKALDDEVFVARIRDWEKTVRKRNGIVGFVTQNAADALNSQISSAIVEQAATQIFTANPKAARADYVTGFGLTDHEYELIRSLPDTAHCFLVKHGNESVVVRLDLSGAAEVLTILSGREKTVRLFDEIRARTGDDPAAWLPELVKVA